MKKMITVLAVLSIFTSGCATIMSGDTQMINLTTNSGEKQKVEIDNKTYTAPAIIEIKRENADKIIKVKGCDNQILLHKEINPTFFVNLLSGGVFGSTTDYSSGSMWKYQPENIKVECD